MTGNRSLDEFTAEDDDSGVAEADVTGAEADDARSETASGDASPPVTVDDPQEADGDVNVPSDETVTVEPMAETFTWSTTGGPCAGCGELVDVRWRDGSAMVCEDCKTW